MSSTYFLYSLYFSTISVISLIALLHSIIFLESARTSGLTNILLSSSYLATTSSNLSNILTPLKFINYNKLISSIPVISCVVICKAFKNASDKSLLLNS